jgi:hypothetical protein
MLREFHPDPNLSDDLQTGSTDTQPPRSKLWNDAYGPPGDSVQQQLPRSEDVHQLRERLILDTQGPSYQTIMRLIQDLGSDQFQVRQAAAQQLEENIGQFALPLLRKALLNPPSEEVRQHIERLIARITGANIQTWDGTFGRDGSGNITGIKYEDADIVHTQIMYNGQGHISHLWLYNPNDPTGDLTFREFGLLGLHFFRTDNGYQVTRLDGGPLPAFMQTAREVSINQQGVITVIWANGGINEFHPVAELYNRPRNEFR